METNQARRQHKDQLYKLFARVSAALANPHRLELLDLLVQAPRTVEELSRETGMSAANTSQHLQRLKHARLVVDERQGLHVRHHLADPAIARLCLELRAAAERQLAEVERVLDAYRHRRHEFQKISAGELRARLRRGEVVLLDVRPRIEYQAGHLPGAISIPLDELERRLIELPPNRMSRLDRLVVVYCRGPYCVFADDALKLLAARGRKAARLEEGVAEWRRAGFPLEREPKTKDRAHVHRTVRG